MGMPNANATTGELITAMTTTNRIVAIAERLAAERHVGGRSRRSVRNAPPPLPPLTGSTGRPVRPRVSQDDSS